MSDVYIYHFIPMNGEEREKPFSTRRGTLAAIKGRGEPVMETQIVVDHTELDQEGFLAARDGNDSNELDGVASEICSLEKRAASRDTAALASTDGIERYMLSLESSELRKQARALKNRHADSHADQRSRDTDTIEVLGFKASLAG